MLSLHVGLVLPYLIFGSLLTTGADEYETTLVKATCDDTTTSIEAAKFWTLTNPKVSHLPDSCKWSFTVAPREMLLVSVRGRLRDTKYGQRPCLVIGDDDPKNVFRILHVAGQRDGAHTWCFRRQLHVEYKARRCPEPATERGLSVSVRRVREGMPFCDKGKAWMLSCTDNLSNKTLQPDTTQCKFGPTEKPTRRPTSSKRPAPTTTKEPPGPPWIPTKKSDNPGTQSKGAVGNTGSDERKISPGPNPHPGQIPEVSEVVTATQACGSWGQSQKLVVLGSCVMAAIFFITLGMILFWYCIKRSGDQERPCSTYYDDQSQQGYNQQERGRQGPALPLRLNIPQSSTFPRGWALPPTPTGEEYPLHPATCPVVPNSGPNLMRMNGGPMMYRKPPEERIRKMSETRNPLEPRSSNEGSYHGRDGGSMSYGSTETVPLPCRKRSQESAMTGSPQDSHMMESARNMQMADKEEARNRRLSQARMPPPIIHDEEDIELKLFSM